MPNIFRHKPTADPAAKRYPEALARLLSLGKPTDDTNYQEWAERLKDHVPDLIRIALQDATNPALVAAARSTSTATDAPSSEGQLAPSPHGIPGGVG